MLLHTLIRQFDPQITLGGIPDIEITGVREDSRQIQFGNLFVARPGTRTDGAAFLYDAADRGAAAAVVAVRAPQVPLPQIVVGDTARAASILANLHAGNPSEMVRVLAVTGTNGKTTTAYLLRHLLGAIGTRTGMIGTVEIDDGHTRREASMTTPGACDLAALLGAMRDNGCRACAIEVSSHALDQQRVAGVAFAGAAFTNLTGDHLDYHGSMENYAAAKARLFESLASSAVAVVNADDEWAGRMLQDCQARHIRFGFGRTADYRARDIAVTAQGTNFVLLTPDGRAEISTPLVGRHNVENLLAASALAGEVFGLSVHQIARGLREAPGAPGRLQPVRLGQPFAVLIDYAHTDDALENVLEALKPITRGKLRVLFGCGGDRDRTKRPRMARIAEKLADALYVTSDNPRTEDPQAILDEVVTGLTTVGRNSAVVEIDRRAAIERILNDAEPDDVILIAGKGHENYQIIGAERRHFDDAEEAIRVIESLMAA
jgi:UDP-N-acetylmuramoyl-L-alanyl-D-glutamate--2,6-diaminopimelate ligase